MSGVGMSHRHQWVLGVGKVESLTATARLLGVVAALTFGKPERGAEFWPSYVALAGAVGVSPRTAQRCMDALVDAGWIERRSGVGGSSNRYTLTIPDMDTPDAMASDSDGSDMGAGDRHMDTGVQGHIDTGVHLSRTQVSTEHIQEQIHLEQIQEQAQVEPSLGQRLKPPCFCFAGETCEECQPEACELHSQYVKPCPHCARRERLDAQGAGYTEMQRKQWYENQNIAEGLSELGDQPRESIATTTGYKSRWR